MENIDALAGEPRQTALDRFCHRLADPSEIGGWQPHLGADGHIGGFELLQHAAEILFRLAIAVLDRRVEVVHPGRKRAGDGALLVERIAAHHQPADRAAAESQHREAHPGAAKDFWFPLPFSPPLR